MSAGATTGIDRDAFLESHLPGKSTAVAALRHKIRDLNSERVDALVRVVLIRGGSGAGKTYLADIMAAHRGWIAVRNTAGNPGHDAPAAAFHEGYQRILIPSFPDTLIESELFGYRAGAFTDAKKSKPGLLGGDEGPEYRDVLLDEIADASAPMQAKLLTLIDTGEFRPVGGQPDDIYQTKARLLLATNRDLEAMVRAGKFREDLYWRMSQFTIEVPPLHAQPEDLDDIARHIESTFRRDIEEPPGIEPRMLTDDDVEWARRHDWPGNIRQLRDAIRIHVFENGVRPLSAIVLEGEARWLATNRSSGTIGAQVVGRLDRAVRTGEPLGSLDELLKEFAREVKQAVVRWYDSNEPSTELLQKVFPDAKPTSVRTKISEWRGA